MSKPKIVGTGPIGQVAIDILEPFGPIAIAPDHRTESLMPLLAEAVGLAVRGEAKIDVAVMDAAPHLKVIARSGVGYNNVDIAEATSRKIPVVYTPGAGARAVAEAALALMLALSKRILHWDTRMKAGDWASRSDISNRDLDGATLGIVGFGRIGQIVAELAKAFNMTILAYDPYVTAQRAEQLGVQIVDLDDLMGQCDFITLHANVTDETRGMINRQRLERVKPGSYLVNLARGDLIESLDIVHEALCNGRLAGAGLDVYSPEPPDVSHPIFKMPNCVTAPHALAMTSGAMERIFRAMAQDMVAVLTGKRPKDVVNPEVL